MNLVVLGLSLSSAWGNGHATTWRALLAAFAARGHEVVFLERDVAWYADHRDLPDPPFCRLELYRDLAGLDAFARLIGAADAVIVGSYVPDGIVVGDWVLKTALGVTAFYDIDTPVTLAALGRGDCGYLSPEQVGRYDLYLSFTGGPTLDDLQDRLGARRALALYCSADTDVYRPLDIDRRWDLSYLGTYSADRQPALEDLLIAPARRAPGLRFVVAGPQYPDDIAWPGNVERLDHVAPADHPAFYGASRYTLNITRADMKRAGYSPSVRLFEAAACGTAIISDAWEGLDTILGPGELVIATDAGAVARALATAPTARDAIAAAGRRRILSSHSARHRAAELEAALQGVVHDTGGKLETTMVG